MELIEHVDHAVAFEVDQIIDRFIYVGAAGHVPTAGWSDPRLSPRFYLVQPKDGVWDFDFYASPPAGLAAEIQLPIAASYQGRAPNWVTAVKIHAADGQDVVVHALSGAKLGVAAKFGLAAQGHVIVERSIAVFDDSFQPTGTIHWSGGFPPIPHIEMKKLRHELTLRVEGPDEAQIHHCIDTSLAAGAIAALLGAFASGGWAAAEAFAATAITTLKGCLGGAFTVEMSDRSHWITWDT